MPAEVFVDASFWVALMLRSDQNHSNARTLWDRALQHDWHRATTNRTLYEAATFVNGRRRHDLAVDLLDIASSTGSVVDASELEADAIAIFRHHSDKQWSVVDCANFACIRERQSSLALAFDQDFAQAQAEFGFTLLGAGAAP